MTFELRSGLSKKDLLRAPSADCLHAGHTDLETKPPTDVEAVRPPYDHRANLGLIEVTERQQLAAAVRQRLSAIIGNEDALREITESIRVVQSAFRGMRDEALRIGRALSRIQARSPKGYQALFVKEENGFAIVPFSESVASKMRTLATWLDSKQFDERVLPLSYSGAYEVSRLDDDGLAKFEAAGLLRPDTTRDQVLAFKRRLRLETKCDDPVAELRKEETRLLARLEEIRSKLQELASEGLNQPHGAAAISARYAVEP